MSSPASSAPLTTSYRWRICALLFVATTINYMDRSVLGVLGPTLQYKVFDWTDAQWGLINMCFKIAYAMGMLSMGAVIDRVGTKTGYSLAIIIWSVSGMLHAAVRPAFSFVGFCLARAGLGLGESGNFPAAIKTVAEWFPKKERALATGIFNAGSNVGAILAPLVIPMVVLADGTHWQYAFLTTGIFSAIWVVMWLSIYRSPEEHPKVGAAERAYILSDSVPENSKEKISWGQVLHLRETWAFTLGKLTDAVWWFYLFWGPKFLFDRFGLDIKSIALPLIIIYVVADVGSIMGGWLSSHWIKKGWSVNRARKSTMLVCACCILPVTFATIMPTSFRLDEAFFGRLQTATYTAEQPTTVDGHTVSTRVEKKVSAETLAKLQALAGKSFGSAKELLVAVKAVLPPDEVNNVSNLLINSARTNNYYWIAVLLMALATAGHQAWSANLFTLVSDVFPKKATASVTGFGGMAGAVAGAFADLLLGQMLSGKGQAAYFYAFLIAGCAYLILLGVIHLLMPKMTPLDENLRHVQT